MGFLIDTYIWIDVERDTLPPADVVSGTGTAPVCISPFKMAELKYGCRIVAEGPLPYAETC